MLVDQFYIKIELLIVYDRREQELPDTFYRIKILFLAKVIAFSNLENTYIYITRANLYCVYLNMAIFCFNVSVYKNQHLLSYLEDMFLDLLSKDLMFIIVLKCSGSELC